MKYEMPSLILQELVVKSVDQTQSGLDEEWAESAKSAHGKVDFLLLGLLATLKNRYISWEWRKGSFQIQETLQQFSAFVFHCFEAVLFFFKWYPLLLTWYTRHIMHLPSQPPTCLLVQLPAGVIWGIPCFLLQSVSETVTVNTGCMPTWERDRTLHRETCVEREQVGTFFLLHPSLESPEGTLELAFLPCFTPLFHPWSLEALPKIIILQQESWTLISIGNKSWTIHLLMIFLPRDC